MAASAMKQLLEKNNFEPLHTFNFSCTSNKEKNHKFLDKSIFIRLVFESFCFHGHTQNANKCSYVLFLIKYKTGDIIMKNEQTTIAFAQWER